MMNSIIFSSKVINEKQNFTANDISDLKEITEKYPYFQLAAMLYSKALLKTNSRDYKKALNKTATIVNNREHLFNYLHRDLYLTDLPNPIINKPVVKHITKTEIITKAKVIINKSPNTSNSNIKSTTETQNPKPIISNGKEINDKKDLMQTVAKNLSNTKEETKKPEDKAANTKINVVPTKVEPSVDKVPEIEIPKTVIPKIATAKNKVPKTEATKVKADNNIKTAETKVKKDETKASETNVNKENTRVEEVKNIVETKQVKTKASKDETFNKSKTVESELVSAKPTAKAKKKIITKAKPKEAKTTNKEKTLTIKKKTVVKAKVKSSSTSRVKTTKEIKVAAIKPVDRKTSITIIEKFIKEDPSINKPEDKAYSEELAIAKLSVRDDYSIVSETMAKLYVAQGNSKKAKKVYEKLILIYPEKNTYFAARISELK